MIFGGGIKTWCWRGVYWGSIFLGGRWGAGMGIIKFLPGAGLAPPPSPPVGKTMQPHFGYTFSTWYPNLNKKKLNKIGNATKHVYMFLSEFE